MCDADKTISANLSPPNLFKQKQIDEYTFFYMKNFYQSEKCRNIKKTVRIFSGREVLLLKGNGSK